MPLCTCVMFISLLCILINSLSVYYWSLNPSICQVPRSRAGTCVGRVWVPSLGYYISLMARHRPPASRLQGILHGSIPLGATSDISGPSAPQRPSPHDQAWVQAVGVAEGRKEGHRLALLQSVWARGWSASVLTYLGHKGCW